MAMYYFARKIERARRPKSPPQQPPDATSELNSRIPNGGIGINCSNENKGVTMPTAQISSPSTSSSSNLEDQPQIVSTSRGQTHLSSSEEAELELGNGQGLMTGSMETLIRHLVPTETHYPDRAFTFSFLLASRLHTPPYEVLGQVLSLAFTTTALGDSTTDLQALPYGMPRSSRESSTEFHTISNVIHLLGEWTQLFPYDFRDERMMVHVRAITERSVQMDSEPIREKVSHLLTTLLARLTALEQHEFLVHRLATEKAFASPLVSSPPSILTICPNPTILAQQLTHLELGRIAFIGPQEFLQDFLKESTTPGTVLPTNSNEPTFQLDANNSNAKTFRDSGATGPKKTRNLLSYLYWHTRLRFFVATEVCRMPKKKLRVTLIEYWIETAKECFNIGNFNSLMAIIMAFNMPPLERLRNTWNKVNKTQLCFLHQQMNPSNNYANYRFLLQKTSETCSFPGAIAIGEERQRVLIPFMSLLVKDLCFLSQECGTKLPNGQIDFAKFWQLAKQVTEFMGWQQVQCSFPKVQGVMNVLQMPTVLMERENGWMKGFKNGKGDLKEIRDFGLFLASYSCESAINPEEREHLHNLQESSLEENFSNESASASASAASENPYSSTTSTSTR